MSTTPLRFPVVARTAQQGGPVRGESHRPSTFIPIALALGATAIALAVGLAAQLNRPTGREDALRTAIQEETIGSQRVLLRDFPDRSWLTYYKVNAERLGEPRWSERPYDIYASCLGFTNYVVCHNPDPKMKGTTWEFLPQLLGSKNLPPGLLPDSRAELAPIVQTFLIHLEATGVDHWYWLGAVQSPAFCPQGSGECFQVFQSQVLRWPASASADNPTAITISPLGLTVNKPS